MQYRLLFAACATLLACVGCSDSKVGTVYGTVTYDGQPAPGLEVEFDPVGPGRGSIGYTDASGQYTMQYTLQKEGALIGAHKVRVSFPPGGKPTFKIPKAYTQRGDTSFEVKRGGNRFDIDMQPET